jgi:hypothetical protein
MGNPRFSDPARRAARYEALYHRHCGDIKVRLPESFHRDYVVFRDGLELMRRQRDETVRAAIAESVRS